MWTAWLYRLLPTRPGRLECVGDGTYRLERKPGEGALLLWKGRRTETGGYTWECMSTSPGFEASDVWQGSFVFFFASFSLFHSLKLTRRRQRTRDGDTGARNIRNVLSDGLYGKRVAPDAL